VGRRPAQRCVINAAGSLVRLSANRCAARDGRVAAASCQRRRRSAAGGRTACLSRSFPVSGSQTRPCRQGASATRPDRAPSARNMVISPGASSRSKRFGFVASPWCLLGIRREGCGPRRAHMTRPSRTDEPARSTKQQRPDQGPASISQLRRRRNEQASRSSPPPFATVLPSSPRSDLRPTNWK
jgi:hypothetical protein